MKNVVFRRETLKMAQKHGNSVPPMRAKHFSFLSQTNSAYLCTKLNKKLSYRRETARQLPTGSG